MYIEQELHFHYADVRIQYRHVIMVIDDKVESNRLFAGIINQRNISKQKHFRLPFYSLTLAAKIPAIFAQRRASPFFVVTLKYD